MDPMTISMLANRAGENRDTMMGLGSGLSQGLVSIILGNRKALGKNRRRAYSDLSGMTNRFNQGALDQIGGELGTLSDVDQQFMDQLSTLSGMDKSLSAEMAKNYFQTTEGSALSEKLRQQGEDSKNKLRNDASLMGLSDEAYVAGLGGINKAQGQGMADLAQGADARRNTMMSQRQSLQSLLSGVNSQRGGLAFNRAGMLSDIYNNSQYNASNLIGNTDGRRQDQINSINSSIGRVFDMLRKSNQ